MLLNTYCLYVHIFSQAYIDALFNSYGLMPWTSFLSCFVVFDPGEENKFAYSEIHNDYHALVS